MTASRRRARLVLIATFAIFFLPVLAAWLLNVAAPEWRPFGQVNRGEIVDPPLRLPDAPLRGTGGERVEPPHLAEQWAIVYVLDGPCAVECEHALDTMRRARLALGRDTARVRRVLILQARGAGGAPATARDDLEVAVASEGWVAALAAAAPPGGEPAGSIYVVDPQGYLIMRHRGDTPVRDLHADLERLLDVSQIGRRDLHPGERLRLASPRRRGPPAPKVDGAVLPTGAGGIIAAASRSRAVCPSPKTTPTNESSV